MSLTLPEGYDFRSVNLLCERQGCSFTLPEEYNFRVFLSSFFIFVNVGKCCRHCVFALAGQRLMALAKAIPPPTLDLGVFPRTRDEDTKREQDVRDVTGFERERALICLHRLPAPTFGKGRAFIASPGDAPARCGTISGHPAGTACWAAVNFARSGMIRWLLNTKTGGQTPSQRHDVYRRFIKPVSRRMFISSAALCC